MSTYTDPKTGFRISDTATPEPTPEELEQTLTARRAARVSELTPEPAAPTFSDIGQGIRGEPVHSLDPDRLNDHQYYLANKARILAAFAAGQIN